MALHAAAFPPWGVWPLALVALAPVFLLLRGRTLLGAATWGWCVGFGVSLAALYWMPAPLGRFASTPLVAGWSLTLAFVAFQAGRWALLGIAFAGASRQGWPEALAFCAAYATSELVFAVPLPWHLGELIEPSIGFVQVADLGGPLLVSVWAASVNVVVARVVGLRRIEVRQWIGPTLVSLAAGGYGAAQQRRWDRELARVPRLHIGMVQGNVSPDRSETAVVLREQIALSTRLLTESPDLIVWTETVAPARFSGAGSTSAVERLIARRLPVPVLLGASRIVEGTAFNSALLVGGSDATCSACRYDKQTLFPLGEFLPLEGTWPELREWFPRAGRYRPGPRAEPLQLGRWRLGVSICFEDLHPVRRHAAGQPVHVLVNLTDDAWFEGTPASEWHFALSRLRAIEQRRSFVRVANTGVSAVIDPLGRVRRLPVQQATARVVGVAMLDGSTPFARLGNGPWWGVATLVALANLVRCPRRRAD